MNTDNQTTKNKLITFFKTLEVVRSSKKLDSEEKYEFIKTLISDTVKNVTEKTPYTIHDQDNLIRVVSDQTESNKEFEQLCKEVIKIPFLVEDTLEGEYFNTNELETRDELFGLEDVEQYCSFSKFNVLWREVRDLQNAIQEEEEDSERLLELKDELKNLQSISDNEDEVVASDSDGTWEAFGEDGTITQIGTHELLQCLTLRINLSPEEFELN